MAVASNWIKHCNDTHEHCQHDGRDPTWIPSRLIHVGIANADVVRLTSKSDRSLPEPYTTLSHCWGAGRPLQLFKDTEDMLCEGIELSKLPKTFQDAVTVTRRFVISYLWIDCLFILQDSQEDLDIELFSMHKVYANSYLNISADWGGDSSAGLFHARDPVVDSWAPTLNMHPKFFEGMRRMGGPPQPSSESPFPEGSLDSSSTENHSSHLVHTEYWEANMRSAHINSRGWVLQERYLSPRFCTSAKSSFYGNAGDLNFRKCILLVSFSIYNLVASR